MLPPGPSPHTDFLSSMTGIQDEGLPEKKKKIQTIHSQSSLYTGIQVGEGGAGEAALQRTSAALTGGQDGEPMFKVIRFRTNKTWGQYQWWPRWEIKDSLEQRDSNVTSTLGDSIRAHGLHPECIVLLKDMGTVEMWSEFHLSP